MCTIFRSAARSASNQTTTQIKIQTSSQLSHQHRNWEQSHTAHDPMEKPHLLQPLKFLITS